MKLSSRLAYALVRVTNPSKVTICRLHIVMDLCALREQVHELRHCNEILLLSTSTSRTPLPRCSRHKTRTVSWEWPCLSVFEIEGRRASLFIPQLTLLRHLAYMVVTASTDELVGTDSRYSWARSCTIQSPSPDVPQTRCEERTNRVLGKFKPMRSPLSVWRVNHSVEARGARLKAVSKLRGLQQPSIV